MSCIFCKIVAGEIPAAKVYESDSIVAFNDINPQAPTHVLIIPKKHIPRTTNIEDADVSLAGRLILVANRIAEDKGIADEGFRLVFNCGPNAGQEVEHIHLHLLGGRRMKWPPG